MGAGQVFHRIDPPGVATCGYKKTKTQLKPNKKKKQLELEGREGRGRDFWKNHPVVGDSPKVFSSKVVCNSITSGATYCSAITHK